jgi:hypothetical protein
MSRKSEEASIEELEAADINEDTRLPFGTAVQRLDYPPRPGFHRYWFNDNPGRIQRALAAGYKHVLDESGKIVHRPVGTNGPSGGVLVGYLMEIPLTWWQKDLAMAQKKLDQTDADIRRGNIEGEVGKDGRYVPASRPIRIDGPGPSR